VAHFEPDFRLRQQGTALSLSAIFCALRAQKMADKKIGKYRSAEGKTPTV
jgi:hypothetical protein